MAPFVSVLIPVYNGERYLKEALNSVIEQTYKNLEIVIINDGSVDQTESIIHDFSDSRIKYFKNVSNLGLIKTLNLGLGLCTGEFVARFDADDVMHPERIEKQVSYLKENADVAVVGSHWRYINENGDVTGHHTAEFGKLKCSLVSILTGENPVGHPAATIRSQILKDHSLHYEDFKDAEDLHLWFNILGKGIYIDNVPELLLDYRIHSDQVSQVNKKGQETLHLKVLQAFYRSFTGEDFNLDVISMYYKGMKRIRLLGSEDRLKVFRINMLLMKSFSKSFRLSKLDRLRFNLFKLKFFLKYKVNR